MPLTPAERKAEREYDARRRRARVQVYLNSAEEVAEWKKLAKSQGFTSVGTWIAHVCRRVQAGEASAKDALSDARRRAAEAENQAEFFKKKLDLITASTNGTPGYTDS